MGGMGSEAKGQWEACPPFLGVWDVVQQGLDPEEGVRRPRVVEEVPAG